MEAPFEKRLRKCGVKRQKRDNANATAQARAFRKKRKLTPEAKELRAVLDEIRDQEERLRLVDSLKESRRRPLDDAHALVKKLTEDLAKAQAAYEAMSEPNYDDLEERYRAIHARIDVLKERAAGMIRAQTQLPVDTSGGGS